MASAQARRLTLAHRQQQQQLRTQVLRDLLAIWPALDWTRLDTTYPAWVTAVGAVVQKHRNTSASLAAAYLQAFKSAEGIPHAQDITLITTLARMDGGKLDSALHSTAVATAKKATGRGVAAYVAMDSAFVMSSGAASRMVLDAGRDVILDDLRRDPLGRGWQRVVGGKACDFCLMLSDRGAVYSADTVDFGAHDHCSCMAEPVYGDDGRHVRDFAPSARNITDSDRERLRSFLAEHYGT